MPQKSLRAVGIRCWSACEFWSGLGDGVREGPGEKRRSDDARAPGVGGIGATPCRAKALEWTGSALDHGGVAGFNGYRQCRRPPEPCIEEGRRSVVFEQTGHVAWCTAVPEAELLMWSLALLVVRTDIYAGVYADGGSVGGGGGVGDAGASGGGGCERGGGSGALSVVWAVGAAWAMRAGGGGEAGGGSGVLRAVWAGGGGVSERAGSEGLWGRCEQCGR